jgi:hypothetical protein
VTRLAWGAIGERFYETGVDRGVLFVDDNPGVAWNGIVSVDENPSGGVARPYYLDGVKYLNQPGREEFEFTIEALYSPQEFDVCDGAAAYQTGVFVMQQRRKSFNFSYRSAIGNDIEFQRHGYKIHLIYNALAKPTSNKHATEDDGLTVTALNWQCTTKPIVIPGFMRSAHIVVDSTLVPAFVLSGLEDILYGTDSTDGRMPTPTEIAELFNDTSAFTVTDNGDGSFTVDGSALAVAEGPTGTFTFSSVGVTVISPGIIELTSTP